MKCNKYLFLAFSILSISIFFSSCTTEKVTPSLFTLIPESDTNIHFKNQFKETLHFNFLNYAYVYNGGGVAAGDINNDGLVDLYFTSNQGSNKLYLNQGNFNFKDITETALVSDTTGWSTGVAMVDINNDGWLDIYVSKSGSLDNHEHRKNKLFINQKDNTFKEEAKAYGLDHYGFSTQAYFFDYDNDDDLDMYLVNHRQDFRNNINIDQRIQLTKEDYNSDQLFRNDNGKFTNITKSAGIENKAWGLSASIGDFNQDGLSDVYVANDFLEPDFLYINQGDGTFTNKALEHFNHISANSMGSDFADINNDLLPDLITLDMMAEDHIRSKENMATMSTENFHKLVEIGYHHQYMTNILQLNNGDGSYSEIGQLSGIAKTDWSWAPLIADFDNDGFNDLYVTNGIAHDLSNQDFRNQMRTNIMNRKKVSLEEAINMMPSDKLSNYAFKNKQDLTFKNSSKDWGVDTPINSNGAVYADLDNDGDLDLVVNNQLETAHIYKNNSVSNYLKIKLKGSKNNTKAIGTTINVFTDTLQQSKTVYLQRGFQSSVDASLIFGLNDVKTIDSIQIIWPNNSIETKRQITVNQTLEISYNNDVTKVASSKEPDAIFSKINPETLGIDYIHKANNYNDFNFQLLLPQKQSEKKIAMAVADVNKDGLDDLFIGNSRDHAAILYLQSSQGSFSKSNVKLFESEKVYEDTDALFFDVDKDGDLDLYVASGGYELTENHPLFSDRLYINNGKGIFTKSNLPEIFTNSTSISSTDIDKDGDIDLFIGAGVKPRKYPLADSSYFLENVNGSLKLNEDKIDTSTLQIVNDAVFTDIDNDTQVDLIIVGEWMPITVYKNDQGKFSKAFEKELSKTNGWYQTLESVDIDNDGYLDFVIGNYGKNNKFHPSEEKPLHIYADYFDANSSFDLALSKVSKTGDLLPVRGKECSTQQTPFISKKIKTFKEFAASSMTDIYGSDKLEKATHLVTHNMASILLKNNSGNGFSTEKLHNYAQMSPSTSFEITDIDNDGVLDILGVGNDYNAEVETVRFDASKNYLLTSKNGTLKPLVDKSFYTKKEAHRIQKIVINGEQHFILLNKNNTPNLFKMNQ